MSPAARRPRGTSTRREAISGPLPRGPHSLSREEVAENQRARILQAMTDTVGEKGYVAASVADIVARAGVSRKAFYEHYESKEACFAAAYEALAAERVQDVEEAYAQTNGGRDGVQATIRALFEGAIENPDAMRLTIAEASAAGPPGVERRERLIAEYARFIRDGVESDGSGELPETTLRAIVGGVTAVLMPRLRRRQRAPLLKLVPEMTQWTFSYHPAPESVLWASANDGSGGADGASRGPAVLGGRAPGTLFPQARAKGRRASARGGGASRSFVVHSQRSRILDAVANLMAAKGYAALTVEDIAMEAGVSLQAFYEHFESKEDAFLVAYELGQEKALDILERAYGESDDWQSGVRDAVAALLLYYAGEPAYTQLALIAGFVALPRTIELAERVMATYTQMLAPGLERTGSAGRGRPPPVTVEAIGGGLTELVFHYAAHGRIRRLPELTSDATYLFLAPFVGPEEAALVATDGQNGGASPSPRGSSRRSQAKRSPAGHTRGRRSPES